MKKLLIFIYKGLYVNACSSFIRNHQKLEPIQMSFKRGMEKQLVMQPYNEYSLAKKRKETADVSIVRMNLKCITSKKSN